MKTSIKKMMSIILSLLMIMSCIPVTAVAADTYYAVTVEGDEHVTVGHTGYAVEGEKVTLDICPDEGWALNTLSVMCGETPVDVAADYSFIMPAGDVTVTVTTKEDDGTTYTITVAETTNGTVKTSVTSAAAKETVTVTVTPDSGYVLETLTFNGTAITANEDGTYTFPMPWAAVTVSATFAEHDPHSYTNGVCTTCGASCTHSGNTNTDDSDCTTEVLCSVCGGVATAAQTSHNFSGSDCTNDGCEVKQITIGTVMVEDWNGDGYAPLGAANSTWTVDEETGLITSATVKMSLYVSSDKGDPYTAENVQLQLTDGVWTLVSDDAAVLYEGDNSTQKFAAIYPFRNISLSNPWLTMSSIPLAPQNDRQFAIQEILLCYGDVESSEINIQFKHVYAALSFNVTLAGEYKDATIETLTVTKLPNAVKQNIFTGEYDDTEMEFTGETEFNSADYLHGLMLPYTSETPLTYGVTVVFADGTTYETTFQPSRTEYGVTTYGFEAGYAYTIDLRIGCDHVDENGEPTWNNGTCTLCGAAHDPHSYENGACTTCGFTCDHGGENSTWENGTCTKCNSVCGTDVEHEFVDGVCKNCNQACEHTENFEAQYDWYRYSDGTCYVSAYLYCTDCGGYVDYASGDATQTSSVEPVDCLTPGSVTYSITLTINGAEYTDTKTYTVESDNHIGEFENGFCSACGGYEKPSTQQGEYEWETVYAIDNAGKLFWFADYINNVSNEANALVTKDITIPEDKEWTPILNFYGTFDGGFKTISGFNCVSDTEYTGMFGGGGYSYGTIKNVHITDSYFEGTSYVGGLAGYHAGTISNCYVDNTVTVVGNDYVGALVGNLAGNMYNCYAYASTAIGSYNSNYASVVSVYYLSETETEDGGKTAEQFASGEVAYLLQAGIVGDDIFDEETGEYIGAADPEHVWGQSIGTEIYPVFKGTKVYGNIIGGCCEENYVLDYSNTQADPIITHNYDENGECVCGDLNYFYIGNLSSQIRFGTNDDGSYNFTFDIRTRAKITDADFTRFIGATNEEAVKNITKAGFVYSINPEGFVIDNAKAVAMGGKVDGYTDAPVKSIWDEDGYYMFSCTVTNIPYTETAQTLVSFAYICVEIDGVEYWYFMEAQAEADFNSLYTTYISMACEAYGWEKLGYVNNNDGTHSPVCEVCGEVDETTKETHKYENGECVCGAATYTYDETTKTYTVYTAEGLYAWNTAAQADLETNLVLMADITLPNTDLTTGEEITVENGVPSGSNWTPISTDWEKGYIGTFEGNNHTITGLRINTEENYASLIGTLGADGEVKNLTLANAVVYGTGSSVSGFVAYISGGTISWCTFGSSTTDGSSVSGAGSVGGIIYKNASGLVSYCTNNGTISASGTDAQAGGIAAQTSNGTVSNCTNNGSVSVSGGGETTFAEAGGIVGYTKSNSTVSGCINNGFVSATGVSISAGGIVGWNANSTVSGCENTGDARVDGTAYTYEGGIVGFNSEGTVDETNDNKGTPTTNVGAG